MQSNFYRTYFLPVRTFIVTVSGPGLWFLCHCWEEQKPHLSKTRTPKVDSQCPMCGTGVINSVLETSLDDLHTLLQKGLDFLPIPHHTLVTHRYLTSQIILNFLSTSCFLSSADNQLQIHWGNCKSCYRVLRWVAHCPYLGERRGRLEPHPDTLQDTL